MVNLEDKFWAKVDIRDDDECWMWRGYTNRIASDFPATLKAKR